MPAATRRLIREGEVMPALTLAAPDGSWKVPGPNTQSTLLVFAHAGSCDECRRYLVELGDAVPELREWAARLLGVVTEGDPSTDGPFPMLIDADGTARRRLGIGDDDAAVLLADRWGEVIEVATFGDDHRFPLSRQLVESAKILDLSCGECNVPSPEWRQA